MKALKFIPVIVAAGFAARAGAAEFYGSVVSRTAIVGPVATAQQSCVDTQQIVPQQRSGGGAALGALIGGGFGNVASHGAGQVAATGLGMIAGALIGDRIEADSQAAATVPVRQCRTINGVENRVIGYEVTYEYNGQRYSARIATDPGQPGAQFPVTVDGLPVAPTLAANASQPAAQTIAQAQPTVVYPAAQPVVVYPGVPVVAPVYAPPVSVNFGVGYGWGWHRHWH